MDRRVLILSYYFPPSGGAGVQRALKFAKYLPSYDWTPAILTVREGAYPETDASMQEDIPAAASVYRTAAWDPYQLYARFTGQSQDDAVVHGSMEGEGQSWKTNLARWVRANVFLPDARVGWVPFAVHRGRQLLSRGDFDVILTTGPPHSTHLAGALLQKWTGTPWVADFRDPWTDINYYQELPHTRWARWVDAALERMVLRRADAVTTVSPTWRKLLLGKVEEEPQAADRFFVVQNGFDEDDMSASGSVPQSSETFDLTHVGSLYASRNPEALWQAFARLRGEQDDFAFRIRLVGTVESNVWRLLEAHGLTDLTEHVSHVAHPTAVAYMRRADLLLLAIEQFPAAEGMMTCKIYEYLASQRPVVGIGPPAGDAADLLNVTGGGKLFDWTDKDGLTQFIRTQYEAWKNGEPKQGAEWDDVRSYRRRAQTGRMANILEASCP